MNRPKCGPAEFCIGATGWLRTCRQAYVEGTEVLYGTNQFCIEGTCLLWRVPDLLIPQHRATIQCARLHFHLHPWRELERQPPGYSEYPPDSGDIKGYFSLLEALPTILPNVVFLHLSLDGKLQPRPPADQTAEVEVFRNLTEALLRPIDEVVRKLPCLSHCYVSVPFFSWVRFLGWNEGMVSVS
jgi:hypothetical protein